MVMDKIQINKKKINDINSDSQEFITCSYKSDNFKSDSYFCREKQYTL